MNVLLVPLLRVADMALEIYLWVIIASVIVHWLYMFEIVDRDSKIVRKIMFILWRFTDPLMAPIRRFVPYVAGFDLSPLILMLGVYFLRGVVGRMILALGG